jgi:hypothetical protein
MAAARMAASVTLFQPTATRLRGVAGGVVG